VEPKKWGFLWHSPDFTARASHPPRQNPCPSCAAFDSSNHRTGTALCRQHVVIGSRASFCQHLRLHQRSLGRSGALRERDGHRHGDRSFAHGEQRWCGSLSDCGFTCGALRAEGFEAGLSGIHADRNPAECGSGNIDVRLEANAVKAAVTVSEDAPVVNTSTSDISGLVGAKESGIAQTSIPRI